MVDIFDNPDVVMAKFVQSLLDRVLQVRYVYTCTVRVCAYIVYTCTVRVCAYT